MTNAPVSNLLSADFLSTESMPKTAWVFWTFGSLVFLLLWDYSAFDLQMARWFGSSQGFALEQHWFWRGILHDRIQKLPWLLELVLVISVFRPFGVFKVLPLERRLQFALTTLLALLLVSVLKLHSHTSCPWELQEFGGHAHYVSHWAWTLSDGGPGGCFPAGHASAGFAFIGGFFAFRHALPQVAQRWLISALLGGALLGLVQQIRGAHYMSHTLWTAWLCWATAACVDISVTQRLLKKSLRNQVGSPVLT